MFEENKVYSFGGKFDYKLSGYIFETIQPSGDCKIGNDVITNVKGKVVNFNERSSEHMLHAGEHEMKQMKEIEVSPVAYFKEGEWLITERKYKCLGDFHKSTFHIYQKAHLLK